MQTARTRAIFIVAALLCLLPQISAAIALLGGIVLALTMGNPFQDRTRHYSSRLLSWSVVGLGAGMNLETVSRVGLQGIGYTVIGIATALVIGIALGRFFKTERNTSLLISIGTAICGGSAIAATAPALRARPHEVSVALAIVFMLNAVALFAFPPIGHALDLTQRQFGLWSALAIHDTSSVVGAGLQYGAQALEVGTVVKLARALWIVPVVIALGFVERRRGAEAQAQKAKRPWFILGFIAMAALVTWVPHLQQAGHVVEAAAKRALVVTLFLIGSGLSREAVKSVGVKPLLQGVALWLIVAGASLFAIQQGWIS